MFKVKYQHSEETRRKMSISHMGKKHTEEEKQKIGMANRGERVERIERKCLYCGKVYRTRKERNLKFCSQKCLLNWQFPNKRKTIKCKQCNKKFKPYYAEIRRGGGKFCSKECYLKWNKGSNHGSWRGGITPERNRLYQSDEYKQWRRTIFIRDEFTCQNCGVKSINIQAHHIKPWSLYPDLIFEIENGITYCKVCHCLIEPRNKFTEYYKKWR